MLDAHDLKAPKPQLPFGRWLLDQKTRPDPIGLLARAAALDPKFPREGSPEDVSAHLNRQQAEHEMHAACDDAELDWRCH